MGQTEPVIFATPEPVGTQELTVQATIANEAHHLPSEQIMTLFDTDPARGLARVEVERRRLEFGLNTLGLPRGPGPIARVLRQFHAPLVYILIAAAVITGLLGEWVDAGVISGVVLTNALIGFIFIFMFFAPTGISMRLESVQPLMPFPPDETYR